MTQTTKATATTDDIYAAIAGNRAARRIVNEILRDTAVRPRTVAGRTYTTAREVERAEKSNAKANAAIIAFIAAVRAAKTQARVEAAITTFKNRTGLLNCDTNPAALAAAIQTA